MNNMRISTDPLRLGVELQATLIESPSVSTFLPEEEASICPLLSNGNGGSIPTAFSHPLNSGNDNDSNTSGNCEDTKAETSSSSGSMSGIGLDLTDAVETTLFNKHTYQHFAKNKENLQESNGHGLNGNLIHATDTPSFVSWNWPLIRKCTFFVFMSSLLGMCAIVVAMMATLPKTCNPKTAWYRGSVFYEIFPASFQDSNNDGLGDLRGIQNRVPYINSMGVSAVRLNSIFPAENYPDNFDNITSLMEIDRVLGTVSDLQQLTEALHAQNISLILDLPLFPYIRRLEETASNNSDTTGKSNRSGKLVSDAVRKWLEIGIDGFYIKGLEMYHADEELLQHITEWKQIIGPNRVLIVDEMIFNFVDEMQSKKILNNIDLVDVHLDVHNGTQFIEKRIKSVLSGIFAPADNGVWIHWSVGGIGKDRITGHKGNGNITLAATMMQLMLPGTPNIFYGDEIALQNAHDPHNEHSDTKHLHHLTTMHWSNASHKFTNRETLPWLPESVSVALENFNQISEMIHLRDRSPSIYKNSICKAEQNLPSTQVRHSQNDIIVVERIYPRRNSFVSVSNFGRKLVTMDMTSMYYSGYAMLGKSRNEKIYFEKFSIGPTSTIIVKLDK